MVCDRCGPSKELGYSFCPQCGNPLNEGCVYCAQYEMEGYEYCGKCGRHLEKREPVVRKNAGPLKMAAMFSIPFIALALVIEIAMMLYCSGEGLSYVAENGTSFFLLLPTIVKTGTFYGTGAEVYFILIMVAIIASMALVLYQSLGALKPRSDEDTSRAEKTPLYAIALLFGSTYIIELIIMGIMTLTGHGMEVPDWIADMTLGETIFEMAEAAVIEEIAARLVIIGIPMALLALCYGRKDFLKNLLGGFGMSRVAVVLLIASATIFAFAHMGSWGIEKVFPTVIGGLALGYLYIQYGIHASIMFHFLTDYLSVILYLNSVVAVALLLIILVAGAVCMVELFRRTYVGVRSIPKLPVSGFESDHSEKE